MPRRNLSGVQPSLRGKRVLVVDDNATNRRILTSYLDAWGMRPRASGSPLEALGWVRGGEHFDVAILDMHMPEMDGVALARAIRQHPMEMALPLVLFTSLGRREARADSEGFAAYLHKPIKPRTARSPRADRRRPDLPRRAAGLDAPDVRGVVVAGEGEGGRVVRQRRARDVGGDQLAPGAARHDAEARVRAGHEGAGRPAGGRSAGGSRGSSRSSRRRRRRAASGRDSRRSRAACAPSRGGRARCSRAAPASGRRRRPPRSRTTRGRAASGSPGSRPPGACGRPAGNGSSIQRSPGSASSASRSSGLQSSVCASSQIRNGASRGTAPSVSSMAILWCCSENTGSVSPRSRAASGRSGPAARTSRSVANGPAAPGTLDPHARDPAARDVHRGQAALDELGAGAAGQLEEMHPELLAGQPAAPARVQERHGVVGDVREVPADQGPVEEQVDARGLGAPVSRGGRRVGRGARRPSWIRKGPAPQPATSLGRLPELAARGRVRRAEHVAPPVHPEHVAAGLGELLEEIDAPVHEPDHRVVGAGPEVPVGLGRLVARERQRRALVDEDDAPHAVARGQMVGGRDPGHAGAADDDVGGRRHGQAGARARLLAEAPDHAPDGVDQRVDLRVGGHDAEGARRTSSGAGCPRSGGRCRGRASSRRRPATTSR